MTNRSQEIWRLINPVTDFPALLAILLGLSIAMFLPDFAIKLIGGCVAILGLVALFLLFSQRMKDIALHTTKPVSETTSFKTTVKQDPTTKRLIFDDFAASFGSDEFPGGPGRKDAAATGGQPASEVLTDADLQSDNVGETALAVDQADNPVASQTVLPDPGTRPKLQFDSSDDFPDDGEGFRIITPDQRPEPEAAPPLEPVSTSAESEVKAAPSGNVDKAGPLPANAATNGTLEISTPAETQLNTEQAAETATKPAEADAIDTAAMTATENKAAETQASDGGASETGAAETPAAEVDASDIPAVGPETAEQGASRPQSAPALQHADEESAVSNEEQEKLSPEVPTGDEDLFDPDAPDMQHQSIGHKRKKLNIQLTEIIEEALDSIRKEPRKEFDYLLSRVLKVIRSVISARTAIFLWVNTDKEELVIESRISDVSELLVSKRKMSFGSDVVSQIAQSGRPEILTEINPHAELDLIPYYEAPAETRSLIGVPVYFNSNVVGILTADTNEEDAYGSQTVSFLGHFTKLISGLIQGYTEKYDLLQSARTLESIDSFRRLVNDPRNTKEDICFALVDSLEQLVPFTTMGICVHDDQRQQWVIAEMRSRGNGRVNLVGQEVFLDDSLIGLAITNAELQKHNEVPPNVVRVTASESPVDNGSYTFVPLKSYSRCFGALFIETAASASLSLQDIQIVEMLAEYAGSMLEQMQLNEVIHDNALADETTGVLNHRAFYQRLHEEFERATDMNLAFSVCIIGIDQYVSLASRLNTEFAEITANHVYSMLNEVLRPYDIVGRLDASTFGVGLIQKNLQEAELWAERLRKKIASSILELQAQQFSVTVSIGVAEYTNQQSLDDLMANANKVAGLAGDKTNAVVVFA